ncbi:MAG: hypothetical protein ACR2N1_14530 [Rubripirellula sp.]
MKTNRFATLLCLSIACVYGAAQIGCSKQESTGTSTTPAGDHSDDDHDHDHDHGDHDHGDHDHGDHDHGDHSHDDHDHGDHAGGDHDHPAHGIRGGHLINLSGDKEVEVQFTDDADKFVIHVADAAKPDTVTKVVMSTTIDGKVADYPLEKAETDDGVVYEITSPALATAVKMGDVVKTTLTISTKDGDISGVYKHHAH